MAVHPTIYPLDLRPDLSEDFAPQRLDPASIFEQHALIEFNQ